MRHRGRSTTGGRSTGRSASRTTRSTRAAKSKGQGGELPRARKAAGPRLIIPPKVDIGRSGTPRTNRPAGRKMQEDASGQSPKRSAARLEARGRREETEERRRARRANRLATRGRLHAAGHKKPQASSLEAEGPPDRRPRHSWRTKEGSRGRQGNKNARRRKRAAVHSNKCNNKADVDIEALELGRHAILDLAAQCNRSARTRP